MLKFFLSELQGKSNDVNAQKTIITIEVSHIMRERFVKHSKTNNENKLVFLTSNEDIWKKQLREENQ